ncbi:MAG: hypothetical protein M3Q71_09850 [Chloroflexota bacterium]|nr:hypothetical protein [Chloroflexota bacterium]
MILAQRGVDPDADAETLTSTLEARAWSVTVEEAGIGRARRYTAHATRVRNNPSEHFFPIIREVVRATGAAPTRALAFVLAKALEKERAS